MFSMRSSVQGIRHKHQKISASRASSSATPPSKASQLPTTTPAQTASTSQSSFQSLKSIRFSKSQNVRIKSPHPLLPLPSHTHPRRRPRSRPAPHHDRLRRPHLSPPRRNRSIKRCRSLRQTKRYAYSPPPTDYPAFSQPLQ